MPHIFFANRNVVLHLCNLLNLIIHHGYIPAQFGSGIIITLIEDHLGDATKIDHYRGITLCCVISKMFEFSLKVNFEIYIADRKATTCMGKIFYAPL